MTFKDVILEASMYDHSKEYFELCKECSELELTEKLIEDQKFAQENASLFEGAELSENYFSEAAEESVIVALTEKADNKKKGLLSRIGSGIKSLIRRFANFLLKMVGNEKKKGLKKKAKEKLKDKGFKQGYDKMANEFNKAMADLESQTGLYIGLNNGKWQLKDLDKFVLEKGVEMSIKEPGKFANAVAIKDIEAVVRELKANPNNEDIKQLTRRFEDTIKNVRSRSKVVLSNDDPDLARIQKEFQEFAQAKVTEEAAKKHGEEMSKVTKEEWEKGVNAETESVECMFESEDISGAGAGDLNRLTALLNKSIADTMKLMTAYNTLSIGVLNQICNVAIA